MGLVTMIQDAMGHMQAGLSNCSYVHDQGNGRDATAAHLFGHSEVTFRILSTASAFPIRRFGVHRN